MLTIGGQYICLVTYKVGFMRKRFGTRTLLAIIAIVALCSAAFVAVQQSIIGRVQVARRIEIMISDLQLQQPQGLHAAQWNSMVFWTLNLHHNNLIAYQTSFSQIEDFESRLKDRLSENVDAETIEWIWDEYAKVCPGGQRYQRFRVMVNEELTAHKSPVLLEWTEEDSEE